MTSWTVHYDMRAPAFGTPAPTLYAAALEQAAWLDERGVTALVVSEHHGEEDGYLPSPLVMAGALAARTRRAMISVNALILALHDPIDAAEQCQVADQISGGRLVLTLVPGYVESEFALYGQSHADPPGGAVRRRLRVGRARARPGRGVWLRLRGARPAGRPGAAAPAADGGPRGGGSGGRLGPHRPARPPRARPLQRLGGGG